MFATVDKNEFDEITLPVNYDNISLALRRVVREQYIKKQNGKCYYCNRRFLQDPPKEIHNKKITRSLFPKNFFMYPIHLHHNRKTGLTIGAVHAWCNAVLFEYHGE